ncbi:MAG: hypothetical protein EXR62_15180 [Chloroflexi bacterium]|nr:hypothetical protein [Chloroflexota bacterium]
MDKGIGFNRNIFLPWLDAVAALRAGTADAAQIRAQLDPIVQQDIASAENRRKAIDILINIWVKTGGVSPRLHQQALHFFQTTPVPGDRLWLHYGMTLLYYPFFRETAAAIGQLSRYTEGITTALVKQRLIADRGELGSLNKAVERVVFSLRKWGIVQDADRRNTYVPQRQTLTANTQDLEAWLLACALWSHPAEELPFNDLVRLPELFPFCFSIGIDCIRQNSAFIVHRQGVSMDMVRLSSVRNVGYYNQEG